MRYKVNYSDAILEFKKNHGRAFLEAADPQAALRATRDLFSHTRDERVETLGDNQYLVMFSISLDYRLPLLHAVEKAVKLLRSNDMYQLGRYLDRYIVATVCMETGKPEFLNEIDVAAEVSSLRKAAVVAREVPNVMRFIDWDIAIYNYLELNSKQGFKSRVVRKVAPRT
ncbi:MAG: hypothetical protein KKA42_03795 [candidate division Zixibacteria bacterium]|nr:hypothetical protein [candidate division Zixibacteria bacterium]